MEPLAPERLLKIRDALGMTQEKLAVVLGCSWVSVSRWEQGHSSPLPSVADIYRALDAALKADWRPAEIAKASQGERGPFLHRLFSMAYGQKGRAR
jgi:transcriptional regulator with XRE-family HTH domain